MRQPSSYCRNCHRDYVNEWHRKRRQADPEWQRERGRRHRAAIKSDADRYADLLARQREWRRGKFGYRRELRRIELDGMQIPSAPFGAWVAHVIERDGTTITDLAARWDVSDKTLYRVRSGEQSRVYLSTVEHVLGMDGTTMIHELYSDEELAA